LAPAIPIDVTPAALTLRLPNQAHPREAGHGRAALSHHQDSSGDRQPLALALAGGPNVRGKITTASQAAIHAETPWCQAFGSSLISDLPADAVAQHLRLLLRVSHQEPHIRTPATTWFDASLNTRKGRRIRRLPIADAWTLRRATDRSLAHQIRPNGVLCKGGSVVDNSLSIERTPQDPASFPPGHQGLWSMSCPAAQR
jgi:hypothetical protein